MNGIGFELDYLHQLWERERGDVIAVFPSRQRCGNIPVLKLLRGWIPQNQILVAVEPTEFAEYQAAYGNEAMVRQIGDVNRGVGFARQSIRDMVFDLGARWMLMLDDDIRAMHVRGERAGAGYYRLLPTEPEDRGALVAGLIGVARAYGCTRASMSSKALNWMCAKPISLLAQQTQFSLFDMRRVRENDVCWRNYILDDIELTLLLAEKRLMWAVWNGAAFECPPVATGEGGCNSLGDRAEQHARSSRELHERYPKLTKFYHDKHNGFLEVATDYQAIRRLYSVTRKSTR